MATVSILLKTMRQLDNNYYSVALRVTHLKARKYFAIRNLVDNTTLPFKCKVNEWRTPSAEDNGLGRFLKSVKHFKEMNEILEEKLLQARQILKSIELHNIEFSFEEFEARLKGTVIIEKKQPSSLISDYYDEKVLELESLNKIGLAEVFKSTQSSLRAFNPSAKLKEINLKFLERSRYNCSFCLQKVSK